MKRSALIAAGLMACASSLPVAAQTDSPGSAPSSSMHRGTQLLPRAYEVELALSAGPEHLRADATVYVFGKSGYEKIKVGTNGFTCLVNRGMTFPPHYMIYAPGVSDGDIGAGEGGSKDRFALPFVYAGYSGGTRTGYIIVLATEGSGHAH